MPLTEIIKNEARRLGFALAGVTTPEPPPHWSVYKNWLALGRHASMNYLADPRRADPLLVLPECKSILVLAMTYPSPKADWAIESHATGQIASYAWGRDYHLVLGEKVCQLAVFIEREVKVPIHFRGYTDTGPLLERDLAQRAGLGWIGRNTCLIHPQIGSCFFLAELLLDIELEPDEPFTADRCGKCHRCVDACPTGCILPDRNLDAGKCISYLTIENKKEIPPELRPLMGNWIFGCDICQAVCPWNKRACPDPFPAFSAPLGEPGPNLVTELEITPQEFKRKFKESPVLRARRSGYLRNVAVALGNSQDASAIPALERIARREIPILSEHAGWALARLRTVDIAPADKPQDNGGQ
jgi:epoxyqueuosine reductase